MKTGCITVFMTCSSRKEANAIVGELLKKRLIACGNIAGTVSSRFWWKGRIDSAKEVMVILKTTHANFSKVKREAKRLHSYEVPEIIALPVVAGSTEYLSWIRDSVV